MRLAPLIALFVVAVLIALSTYTVHETQTAVRFQFKEIVEKDIQPGLHFKWPLIDKVQYFSRQILTLDANEDQYITSEKKYLDVDFFVKWRIDEKNVESFYRTTRGDLKRASNRLESIARDAMKNAFSSRTIAEAIDGERQDLMEEVKKNTAVSARDLGIQVVDVRVSTIDFQEANYDSIFNRMRSERARVAQDFRSRGKAEGEKIRAEADRKATVIGANAYEQAEKIRGEGDAQSAKIYAEAYNKDPEFYEFTRSLKAYANSMQSSNDVMVVSPDSSFFKYFKKAQ